MTWQQPVPGIASQVITAAYSQANIVVPITHLRLMTGNADPPGSGYVVISTGVGGTTWQRIYTDAILDAAITAAKMAASSVGTSALVDSSITNPKLAANSVGTVNLIDGTITGAKLVDATVAAAKLASDVRTVPVGLIAAFRTAAAIATGWTRFTDGDGRLLVGAGTTFSVTFTEDQAVGSSWAHNHAATGLTWGGGFTGTAADVITIQSGSGAQASAASHQNSILSAQAVGGSTANATWTPVARVVVWAIRT